MSSVCSDVWVTIPKPERSDTLASISAVREAETEDLEVVEETLGAGVGRDFKDWFEGEFRDEAFIRRRLRRDALTVS